MKSQSYSISLFGITVRYIQCDGCITQYAAVNFTPKQIAVNAFLNETYSNYNDLKTDAAAYRKLGYEKTLEHKINFWCPFVNPDDIKCDPLSYINNNNIWISEYAKCLV